MWITIKKFLKGAYKSYTAATPIFWRKIGDACLIIGTSISTYSVTHDDHRAAIIALIIGTIGKLLTNFFSESNK